MYMRRNLADLRRRDLSHTAALHGYIQMPLQAHRVEMQGLSAIPVQNFGLVVMVGWRTRMDETGIS
jgi:hypothetical protein